MALPSLIHLELQDINSFQDKPSRRPVVLHTLQSLREQSSHIGFLSLIHAASLTVLILECDSFWTHTCEFHFPSLHHLVLLNGTQQSCTILTQFPGIERLTLNMAAAQMGVENVLAALGPRIVLETFGQHTHKAGTRLSTVHQRLRTLALSPSYDRPPNIAKLASEIAMLKREGNPISKLMLPEIWVAQAGADLEALAELRKSVEIEDFRVDWPTPFSSEKFTHQ